MDASITDSEKPIQCPPHPLSQLNPMTMTASSTCAISEIYPSQLEDVRELIAEHYGFWVKDSWLEQLKSRMGEEMRKGGIRDYFDYWALLTQQNTSGRFEKLQALMEEMCIHETHFGRTEPHFDALRLHVLPSLFSQKSHQKIRIASMGCSSGEEPYSIAMTICESFPPEKREWVEITGLDVSNRILETARAALYSEFQLRDLDADRRQHWFTQEGDLWSVRPEIRRMVRFHQHNLMNPLLMTGIDVIFCRNVMIYFQRPVIERILREFYQAMNAGGFLFLGHAETAFDFADLYRPVGRVSDAVIYQRNPLKLPSNVQSKRGTSPQRGETASNS